jgi:hypothetical protein
MASTQAPACQLIEDQNDIVEFVPQLMTKVERWIPTDQGYTSTEMMKFRYGWNTKLADAVLIARFVTLLKNKGFSELEHGSGFTRISMPPKTFAFYRFEHHSAVDIYPREKDLLMSTNPGSKSIAGFMFTWCYNHIEYFKYL